MKRFFLILLGIMVGILSIGIGAYADPILWDQHTNYGDPVNQALWEGYYVQYKRGIYATEKWASSDTKLAWNISKSGGCTHMNTLFPRQLLMVKKLAILYLN